MTQNQHLYRYIDFLGIIDFLMNLFLKSSYSLIPSYLLIKVYLMLILELYGFFMNNLLILMLLLLILCCSRFLGSMCDIIHSRYRLILFCCIRGIFQDFFVSLICEDHDIGYS